MFRYLLALNQVQRAVLKVDVTNGQSTILVSGLDAAPDGIVIDPQREHIYWTNMGTPTLPEWRAPQSEADVDFHRRNGSIERANLDGSERSFLLPEGSFVTGKQLTGAWAQGRLFWADREGAAVRSVRLDGTDLRDEVVVATTESDKAIERNQCVGVAVDERNGLLYWTQKGPSKGNDGRIFRTALDSTAPNRVIEVLWSGLPEPIDIELDTDSGTIYWTDRGTPPRGNTLNKADIPPLGEPGGPVTVVSDDYQEAIGLALDKDAGIAYVSDLSGEIRAVMLNGDGDRVVFKTEGNLTGLAGIEAPAPI